jgi:hypothetical protein
LKSAEKSNRREIRIIRQNLLGLFATGLLSGMSIIMAGTASLINKSIEAIILSGIAMFFIFFSIFFYIRISIHKPPASFKFRSMICLLPVTEEPFQFSPAEPVAYELSYNVKINS